MIKITSYTFSGAGPRAVMQDAGLFSRPDDQNNAWCITCDGIGGLPGGKEAATICIETLDRFFKESRTMETTESIPDFIRLGMLPVQDAFYTHIEKGQRHVQMGCAMALAYFEAAKACFAWCGDARIYHFRKGKVIFNSLPHNPVFDEYRAGKISLQQANRKNTHVITRSFSASDAFPLLEFHTAGIRQGDRVMVCTDGVWKTLEIMEFAALATTKNMNSMIGSINLKLQKEATDNYWGWLGLLE